MRELLAEAAEHDDRIKLAVELFCYRVRKYLGYLAAMTGADAIVFAGGMAKTPMIRERICAGLDWLGIDVDPEQFGAAEEGGSHRPRRIAHRWVIPTDEELLIARDTWRVVTGAELAKS